MPLVVEMEFVGVRVELPENAPVALLREIGGARRMLPIYIGSVEATAIAYATQGVVTPRPMTHDLLRDVLATLDAHAVRIEITELREHIFFAEIELHRGEEVFRVSSRPSDALALAVRTGTPIFASEDVLDAAAMPVTDDASTEDLVDEFREFIEAVSPEDFGS